MLLIASTDAGALNLHQCLEYSDTEHRLTDSCPTCEEGFWGDRIAKREHSTKTRWRGGRFSQAHHL